MRIDPKYKFLVIIAFCVAHMYRDHLQIQGVHNLFTEVGHEVKSVKHEKDGMFLLGIIASLSLYFFEKDEEVEVEDRHSIVHKLLARN